MGAFKLMKQLVARRSYLRSIDSPKLGHRCLDIISNVQELKGRVQRPDHAGSRRKRGSAEEGTRQLIVEGDEIAQLNIRNLRFCYRCTARVFRKGMCNTDEWFANEHEGFRNPPYSYIMYHVSEFGSSGQPNSHHQPPKQMLNNCTREVLFTKKMEPSNTII